MRIYSVRAFLDSHVADYITTFLRECEREREEEKKFNLKPGVAVAAVDGRNVVFVDVVVVVVVVVVVDVVEAEDVDKLMPVLL